MTIEFKEWPKTSRFFRDIVITEKIDGTNAAIGIKQVSSEGNHHDPHGIDYVYFNDGMYEVYAQSRSKLITPGKSTDNYGFAGWVAEHSIELVQHLGEGLHFGEWWGSGIQRGYGLEKGEKHFSLFNTARFSGIEEASNDLLRCVPLFYEGPMDQEEVEHALRTLRILGSKAQIGFRNPEGVCIYHTSSRIVQKATLDANDAGKWEYAA